MICLGDTRWKVEWLEIPEHVSWNGEEYVSTDPEFHRDDLIDQLDDCQAIFNSKAKAVDWARKTVKGNQDRMFHYYADVIPQIVVWSGSEFEILEWSKDPDYDAIRMESDGEVETIDDCNFE